MSGGAGCALADQEAETVVVSNPRKKNRVVSNPRKPTSSGILLAHGPFLLKTPHESKAVPQAGE